MTDLKRRFDEIDSAVIEDASTGFTASRLRILTGIWEKGEAIVNFRGGKVNFLELEAETGRARQSLKKWYDAFTSYPERDEYIEKIARPRAEAWTVKALNKGCSPPRILDNGLVPAETACAENLQSLIDRGSRFGTIYADPPWLYSNQGTRAATSNHYDGMTVDELCELPIKELAADDSFLHLWTTNAFLFECPKILAAWGFKYRGVFVWIKPQMGIGNYWRVSHEFLLLARRGSPKWRDASLMSWGQFDRTKHSAKPEQIRQMIEGACGGPYLELFGRRPASGWIVWGNEIEKNIFEKSIANI